MLLKYYTGNNHIYENLQNFTNKEFLTFKKGIIPFVPYGESLDYDEIYGTPLDLKSFESLTRVINKNYVSYYSAKRLYARANYFKDFVKERGISHDPRAYIEDVNHNACVSVFNSWLWDTIRLDFKKSIVSILKQSSIYKKKGYLAAKDDGIILIYKQRVLYWENIIDSLDQLARINKYLFMQNFRPPCPNVRINNPYIAFREQRKPYDNTLKVSVGVKLGRTTSACT